MNARDESGAQKALDGMGLTHLSPDGAVLLRALADWLGAIAPDLPWSEGPGLWRTQDVEAHVAAFADHAWAAGLLAKAGGWDESKHPRVPAGSPGGGRFLSTGEAEGAPATPPVEGSGTGPDGSPIRLPPIDVGSDEPAQTQSDANSAPPLPPPPEIPKEKESLSEKLRNAFAREAARWLGRALAGAELGPAGEFLANLDAAAETAAWVYDKYPYIKAYLDEPKSLDELQGDVGKAQKGYEVHHIVEQSSAAQDGYSREDIDAPDNLVRIPTLKHWEITGWYMTPSKSFGNVSPRQYLKDKSWEERRKVGIDALMQAKVLKP